MCKNCYCKPLNLGCYSVCSGELLINYFATEMSETVEFSVDSPSGFRTQLSHLVMGQQLYFSLDGLNEASQHVIIAHNHTTGERLYFDDGTNVYDAFIITTGNQIPAQTPELTLSETPINC